MKTKVFLFLFLTLLQWVVNVKTMANANLHQLTMIVLEN